MTRTTSPLNRRLTWELALWTITFGRHSRASLSISTPQLSALRPTHTNCEQVCVKTHFIPKQPHLISCVQTDSAMMVQKRCLPNKEGGCCRWRGGCGRYRYGETCLTGASQSAVCHGAAAVGHGGDCRLHGGNIPVCNSHQTVGLLTHGCRDKTTTTVFTFHMHLPRYIC